MPLTNETCIPCETATGKLSPEAVAELLPSVPDWAIIDTGSAIERAWKFKNYVLAQAFVLRVGAVAEAENHHPDIAFGWGYARVKIQTHSVGGLTRNDFVLAAKIDAMPA